MLSDGSMGFIVGRTPVTPGMTGESGMTEKGQLSRRMSFMDYLKTSAYSRYLTTIPCDLA